MRRKKMIISLWVLGIILVMAVIGPWISSYTYYATHLSLKNSPPSWQFLFGTDELGRDLFTRIWWGARISLFVGLTAAFIDLVVGGLIGSLAGLFGGKIDLFLMRTADILYTVPYLLLVILLTVIMGSGLMTILVAVTLTGWIPMARIVRGQIMQLKNLDFVQAAYALGGEHRHVLRHHLLPNAFGTIITTVTFTIPTAIFTEAFLSFLGLGVQAPVASWGVMAYDGLSALRYYPWRLLFPAFFITLTMLCFNMMGDGLRDAFDPRTKT